MTPRRALPNRRATETIKYEFGGLKWFASIGRYDTGEVAEVFLSSAKTGSLALAMAKDCAVLLSIALQYGVPLSVIRAALTRGYQGEAGSPLSKALELADDGRRT